MKSEQVCLLTTGLGSHIFISTKTETLRDGAEKRKMSDISKASFDVEEPSVSAVIGGAHRGQPASCLLSQGHSRRTRAGESRERSAEEPRRGTQRVSALKKKQACGKVKPPPHPLPPTPPPFLPNFLFLHLRAGTRPQQRSSPLNINAASGCYRHRRAPTHSSPVHGCYYTVLL